MENRIRQLREGIHMTQVNLAAALEVSQETISAYESGKNYPTVARLLKLSEIFQARCDYILGLSDIRFPCQNQQLSEDELTLLNKYQMLQEEYKDNLQAYLDGLLVSQKNAER